MITFEHSQSGEPERVLNIILGFFKHPQSTWIYVSYAAIDQPYQTQTLNIKHFGLYFANEGLPYKTICLKIQNTGFDTHTKFMNFGNISKMSKSELKCRPKLVSKRRQD